MNEWFHNLGLGVALVGIAGLILIFLYNVLTLIFEFMPFYVNVLIVIAGIGILIVFLSLILPEKIWTSKPEGDEE